MPPSVMLRSRWTRSALVLAGLLAVLAAAHVARDRLGLETTLEGLRRQVAVIGWWGPAAWLALMTLRQFLALPSALLLTTAGICFGLPTATVVGAAGLVLSAILSFVLARGVLRNWVARHEGSRARRLGALVERVGPVVIGISTAHPMGLLTPLHWAAGLSRLPLRAFVLALVAGAPARAFAYALFGAALLDPGSTAFHSASVLAVVSVAALAIPPVRRWLFGEPARRRARDVRDPTGDAGGRTLR